MNSYPYGGIFSPFKDAKASVSKVTIGDNVITVYPIFSEFYNLNTVMLGKNVAYLRTEAFKGCGIKNFYITGDEAPYCYPNVFANVTLRNATLYAPSDKLEYYQTTAPWSGFGEFKGTAPTAIEHVVATSPNDVSTGAVYYNLNGQAVRKVTQTTPTDLPSGIYIVNGKKVLVK